MADKKPAKKKTKKAAPAGPTAPSAKGRSFSMANGGTYFKDGKVTTAPKAAKGAAGKPSNLGAGLTGKSDLGIGFDQPKKLEAARAGVLKAGQTLRGNKARRAEINAELAKSKRSKTAPTDAQRKKMQKELDSMKAGGKAARAERKAAGMSSEG